MKLIQRLQFHHSVINEIRRFIQNLKVQGVKQKASDSESSDEEQITDVHKVIQLASALTPSIVQEVEKEKASMADASEIKIPSEARYFK